VSENVLSLEWERKLDKAAVAAPLEATSHSNTKACTKLTAVKLRYYDSLAISAVKADKARARSQRQVLAGRILGRPSGKRSNRERQHVDNCK